MTSQLKVDRISPANGSEIIIEGGKIEPLTRSVEEEQLRTSDISHQQDRNQPNLR